jgi:hypothetical protein
VSEDDGVNISSGEVVRAQARFVSGFDGAVSRARQVDAIRSQPGSPGPIPLWGGGTPLQTSRVVGVPPGAWAFDLPATCPHLRQTALLAASSRDPFRAEKGRDAHSDSIRRPDLERHPRAGVVPACGLDRDRSHTRRPVTRRVTRGTATTRLATAPDRPTRRVLPSLDTTSLGGVGSRQDLLDDCRRGVSVMLAVLPSPLC